MQWRYPLFGSSLSGYLQNCAFQRDFTFKRNDAAANSASMKKSIIILAPLSMLALAACNKSETPAADQAAGTDTAAATGAEVAMPPAITASGTYRCADNTILYVDFIGNNEAADIRVGDKAAAAVRVTAPVAAAPAAPAGGAAPAPADAAPAGPMKSADGGNSLSGSGKQINVMLAGKGAQTCKSS
jgi:hypothetical protein